MAFARDDLRSIPGVGESLARDLRDLGYSSPADLAGEDPERMYRRLCELRGGPVDRCVLYVFRCAVYYASSEAPDPELLKWWRWKDRPEAPG
ncbi:MAG: pathogenicity locus [Acidobacteria bacterium]|nr:MAG: pathogenicity locus [Acidobacteriota bacterium]